MFSMYDAIVPSFGFISPSSMDDLKGPRHGFFGMCVYDKTMLGVMCVVRRTSKGVPSDNLCNMG